MPAAHNIIPDSRGRNRRITRLRSSSDINQVGGQPGTHNIFVNFSFLKCGFKQLWWYQTPFASSSEFCSQLQDLNSSSKPTWNVFRASGLRHVVTSHILYPTPTYIKHASLNVSSLAGPPLGGEFLQRAVGSSYFFLETRLETDPQSRGMLTYLDRCHSSV